MTSSNRALLQIHFCVVLWGFTAILGKLITLPALALVWWRTLLVSGVLLLLPRCWAGLRNMPPRLIGIYAGTGVVVALHWLTFYGSVKLASASVGATCMALIPVCVAFADPLVARRRFDVRELVFGVAVIPGVVLVVGGTPSGMHLGIAVGVVSALLAAVFSILNKRYIGQSDALTVTGIEIGAAVLTVSLIHGVGLVLSGGASPLMGGEPLLVLPGWRDGALLLLLGLGCTLLPFSLSLVALRELSAFTAVLAVNMEPVYAVAMAMLLLGEQRDLDPSFYAGVALIVAVVLTHSLLARRRRSAALGVGAS